MICLSRSRVPSRTSSILFKPKHRFPSRKEKNEGRIEKRDDKREKKRSDMTNGIEERTKRNRKSVVKNMKEDLKNFCVYRTTFTGDDDEKLKLLFGCGSYFLHYKTPVILFPIPRDLFRLAVVNFLIWSFSFFD